MGQGSEPVQVSALWLPYPVARFPAEWPQAGGMARRLSFLHGMEIPGYGLSRHTAMTLYSKGNCGQGVPPCMGDWPCASTSIG